MKQDAIIFDLDGTLCDSPHIEHNSYPTIDWESFHENNTDCPSFPWAVQMIELYQQAGYCIIFLTARDDTPRTRELTEQWLVRHLSFVNEESFTEHPLVMCKPLDFREDSVGKVELYISEIQPFYNVHLFVDDKASNCRAFRELGIPSLCCAEKD